MKSKLYITLVALLALGLAIPSLMLTPQHAFAGGDDDEEDDCGAAAAAAAAEDSAAAAAASGCDDDDDGGGSASSCSGSRFWISSEWQLQVDLRQLRQQQAKVRGLDSLSKIFPQ